MPISLRRLKLLFIFFLIAGGGVIFLLNPRLYPVTLLTLLVAIVIVLVSGRRSKKVVSVSQYQKTRLVPADERLRQREYRKLLNKYHQKKF